MKKLCFYTDDEVKERFKKEFPEMEFIKGVVQDLEEDDFKKFQNVEVITSFISSLFTAEVIDKFPNLKMIATRSTGTDHIDLEYCQQKGIEVKNVPDYGSNTVAEHTFALLLAISRKVFYSYEKVQEDNSFSRRGMQDLRGFDLAGKTMGVIGTGKIGKNVIKIAEGFQMNVLAYDTFPDKSIENDNCKCVEIDELLKKADIISLHIPALPETEHFINREKMEKMKEGVILLNTARGSIVDNKALLEFLENKKVKAAGLDVLEHEDCLGREERDTNPCVEEAKAINKKFIKMSNVIVTPHNAFNTQEALERIWQKTIDNIKTNKSEYDSDRNKN